MSGLISSPLFFEKKSNTFTSTLLGRHDVSHNYADLASFTQSDILHEGYLSKRGSFIKSWKKRYFILRKDIHALRYYESKENLVLLGNIQMNGKHIRILEDGITMCIGKGPNQHADDFLLRGISLDEVVQWKLSLEKDIMDVAAIISRSPPLLGIKVSYFETFLRENGGREKFKGKQTKEVCASVIQSLCRDSSLSICQQLYLQNSPKVGPPTWFVSHTWSYQFLDTIEAVIVTLERLVGKIAAQDVIVWFDLFSLVQEGYRLDIEFEFLSHEFVNNVQRIGKLLMVMLPWDNPVTLTRAWCVFEAYACMYSKSRFEVAMTDAENNRFLESTKRSNSAFFQMLSHINSAKSLAGNPRDQQMIHRAIQEKIDGGFIALDRTIFSELENWMTILLKGKIAAASDDVEQADWIHSLANLYQMSGKPSRAEQLYEDCLSTRRRVLGATDQATLAVMGNLAVLYKSQGKYEKAEELSIDCVSNCRRLLGDDHASTLTAIANLAQLYRAQGKYDDAEPLLFECMVTFRRLLGNKHKSTLSAIGMIAGLYQAQGKYEKAEPLFVEVVANMHKVLGNDHPHTLSAINNLATLYSSQGKHEVAEKMYVDCLATCRRVLGDMHPSTLTSTGNLAGLYKAQSKYSKAEAMLVDCVQGLTTVVGPDHPDTLAFKNNLASLYEVQSKFSEAEPLYIDCLTARRRAFGDSHPSTLTSINNLASFFKSQKVYEKAEPLLIECLETSRLRLGADHPDTLTSIGNLASLYEAQCQYDMAEPLYRDCLESRRRVLGENHPSTITAINNLGMFFKQQQKYEQAIPFLVDCLAISRSVFGNDHPSTTAVLFNLYESYKLQGDTEKAKPLFEEYSRTHAVSNELSSW